MIKCAAPLEDKKNEDPELAWVSDVEAQKTNIYVTTSRRAKTHLTDRTDGNSWRNLSKADEFQCSLRHLSQRSWATSWINKKLC